MSFGDELFVYDGMGNPTTYRGKQCTWAKGRQLVNYNGNAFTYDGHGWRISKNGITFSYDSNRRLLKQSNGIDFIYDDKGVVGLTYESKTYIYRKVEDINLTSPSVFYCCLWR